MSKNIHLVAISGSLRKASTNTGMLRYAAANLPEHVTMEIVNVHNLPFFNSDDEQESPTEVVATFLQKMAHADAFVFACPEYNYSIAPALKNAIDWASRAPNNAILSGKAVAIMGSGGGMGTSRAQYHLRQVCTCVNLLPINKPEVFANAFTGGFDEHGNVQDEKLQNLIKQQLLALQTFALKLSS